MLNKAWNNVVYGCQTARQYYDSTVIAAMDRRINEARSGARIFYPPTHYSLTPFPVRIPLTAEESARIIAQEEKDRAALTAVMAARREKYDLKL